MKGRLGCSIATALAATVIVVGDAGAARAAARLRPPDAGQATRDVGHLLRYGDRGSTSSASRPAARSSSCTGSPRGARPAARRPGHEVVVEVTIGAGGRVSAVDVRETAGTGCPEATPALLALLGIDGASRAPAAEA